MDKLSGISAFDLCQLRFDTPKFLLGRRDICGGEVLRDPLDLTHSGKRQGALQEADAPVLRPVVCGRRNRESPSAFSGFVVEEEAAVVAGRTATLRR